MVFVYAFFGILCLGLAPLFGKMALNSVSPITAFALRTVIAAVLVMAWLIGSRSYQELFHVPPMFWLFIFSEAVLAALLGDLAYFAALKNGNVNEVVLIMSCAPLITLLFSHFFLGENISARQFIGASLVTLGMVFVSWD